jgi:glycosyltransferase involved in cell wall biosynthesis
VAKTIHELVNSIRKNGHEFAIWSSDVPEEVATEYNVRRTPSLPVFAYPAYRFGFFGSKTSREIDSFSPDIIHISTPDMAGLGFLRYGLKRGIPVSSVFHTDFPSYMSYYHVSFLKPLLWMYLRRFYNSCNTVLAPTKDVKRRLELKGIRNVDIWARGIHLDMYNPSKRSIEFRDRYGLSDEMIILFSGRLVHYKGLDVLIAVYDEVSRRYGDKIKFLVIGSGPEEGKLKKMMPDAVFPGYLTGETLYQAYASSDIFLFPSTTETFGNVILEAMASGLPCIVSDKGGCRELVNESNAGMISRSDDILSFSENCFKMIEDPTLRKRFKGNAFSFSCIMSWDKINGKLLKKYSDMVLTNEGSQKT